MRLQFFVDGNENLPCVRPQAKCRMGRHLQGYHLHPDLTDEEPEAQRGEVSC